MPWKFSMQNYFSMFFKAGFMFFPRDPDNLKILLP
jgi:hypothetical protein